jgi:hypothetical protein
MSSNDLSQLAIATLGVTFAGSWLAMRGDGSEKAKTPPTNASSKDEEAFIQYGSYLTSPSNQPLTNPKGNSLKAPNRRRRKQNIRLKQEEFCPRRSCGQNRRPRADSRADDEARKHLYILQIHALVKPRSASCRVGDENGSLLEC